MARLSRTTKEIIKTTVVVIVVLLLAFFYWIYPLNRAKAMWGRTDLDNYEKDSVLAKPNDPAPFEATNQVVDTFRLEVDANTILAAVLVHPASSPSPHGTIILVHTEKSDRAGLAGLCRVLVDSGFSVVAYDQRASGLSIGKYHSDGRMESADLEALVAHLGIHSQLPAPLVVVGWRSGADAALLAQVDEKRITAVLAIEPYLSSTRFIESYQSEFQSWKFPFWRTLLWFWFNARSSYGLGYVNSTDVVAVGGRAMMMLSEADQHSVEITTLKTKSGSTIAIRPLETDMNKLAEIIVSLAAVQPATQ